MKAHTSQFKENIKTIGRQLDSKITYELDGVAQTLTAEELNNVTPTYQGAILKSVMKELDIDSNVDIPLGTILRYQFGVLVNNEYEYLDFGNYVVYSSEKQEDTRSYKIVCYDKMLYSMKTNEDLGITYPISVRDYINALCTKLGLEFKNKEEEFANYNRQITSELYAGLDYTYRDIFDELAQVTASTICLDSNDKVEIRYISSESVDTFDEEFLKDVNVNFGDKYGKINSIVLSRSAESDNVYLQDEESVAQNGLCELKIIDNQIMNFNDRADYLSDILKKLNGLEYYINDFASTGITYLEICDRYNVQIGDNTYSCVMLNDEILVTQGLKENVYTEMPAETETDYTKADKDDRKINNVSLIVDKQNNEINALREEVVSLTDFIKEKTTVGNNLKLESTSTSLGAINKLSIKGFKLQTLYPDMAYPSEYTYPGALNFYTLIFSNEKVVYSLELPTPNNQEELYNVGGLSGKFYKCINNEWVEKTDLSNVNILYINSPVPLQTLASGNKTYYDEIIIENNTAKIVQRIGWNEVEQKYVVLDKEVEHKIGGLNLPTFESETYLTLKYFEDLTFYAKYLISNEFTKNFATETQITSLINITDEIELSVSKKVNEDEIISKINVSPENIKISAKDKLSLEGYTTINNGFSVDLDGSMSCNNANINGDLVTAKGVLTNLIFPCEIWGWHNENVYDGQGGGFIGFNFDAELTSVQKSFLNFTVRIPNGFTVKSAKIHLKHTPVNWYNPDGTASNVGRCQNMRVYNAYNLGATANGAYFSEFNIGGNTPSLIQIDKVNQFGFSTNYETYSTEDFASIFTNSGDYNIVVATTISNPSATIENAYVNLGQYTGVLTGVLEVIGYTKNV